MTDFPPPGGSLPPPGSGPAPGWWQASDGNWYPPDQQPGYGAPTGYGYGYPMQAAKGTNGFAIASLICSLLAFATCLSGILGIIFGHVALSQIKKTQENGRGMAIAGLIIGYLGLLLIVFFFIAIFALGESADNEFNDFGNDLGWILR